MPQLTDNQRQLLTEAAASESGKVDLPPKRPSGVAGLIKSGLAIVTANEDGPATLLITTAGRVAIGETPSGKIGVLIILLRRPEGADVPTMMTATGWQAHSVRGAIAGTIKKKLGLEVLSTKTDAGRVYRIA